MSNDRISYLSDSLLSHILSFLHTKEVVATSILSKRWRTLWRSHTTLNLCDVAHTQNQTQYLRYVEFVYSFLISRDIQPIKTFNLHSVSPFTCNSTINKWVNHAIQRQVEHLEIIYYQQQGPQLFILPSIFTCGTIVTLKLSGLNVSDFSCVCLPSLKILHLSYVHFANNACVAKLLSSCTLVEDLVLSITPDLDPGLDKGCYEIFPKLIKADIDFDMTWTPLCMAEFLSLNLYRFGDFKDVPTFPNLVHLELHLFSFNWRRLAQILKKSPKLQILVIHNHKGKKASSNIDEMLAHFGIGSTARLPSNLKKCHMRKFEGKEGELQFAKYIMENATVLTTMKISSNALNSDAQLQMTQKLLSFKRISPNCQLLFE